MSHTTLKIDTRTSGGVSGQHDKYSHGGWTVNAPGKEEMFFPWDMPISVVDALESMGIDPDDPAVEIVFNG